MFQVANRLAPRFTPLHPQDNIHGYYLIKELNNCITTLRTHSKQLQQQQKGAEAKTKKDSLAAKSKKISITLPKKPTPQVDPQIIQRHQFDLVCLSALKKSSANTQEALE